MVIVSGIGEQQHHHNEEHSVHNDSTCVDDLALKPHVTQPVLVIVVCKQLVKCSIPAQNVRSQEVSNEQTVKQLLAKSFFWLKQTFFDSHISDIVVFLKVNDHPGVHPFEQLSRNCRVLEIRFINIDDS